MQFHFISGLPRSGSTLLASILRQNPKFQASIMSPVGRMITDMQVALGHDNEADTFIDDGDRARILRSIFQTYYTLRRGGAHVVFDTNRRWCANAGLLDTLFPGSRIICCVRPPAAVLDSFERLFQKNPLSLSVIYGRQANTTVYDRAREIMGSGGVLGFALNAFRAAYFGPHRQNLHIVSYDALATHPEETMVALHKSLGQPMHKYNFERILPIPGAKDFDRDVSTPGLHDLKPRVEYTVRESILPHDIFASMPPPFWLNETATKPQ